MHPIQVFISSRESELKEEREAVEHAVIILWNNEKIPFKYWKWEHAKEIPSGKQADDVQSEGVKNSAIYVLILGEEYGNFEYGESPTHKEYDVACSEVEEDCILIYIKEVEEREDKLGKWIGKIKTKHTYKSFKDVTELQHFVEDKLRHLCFDRSFSLMEQNVKSDKDDIITKIYSKLWACEDGMRSLTNLRVFGGESNKSDKLKIAAKVATKFFEFYRINRIQLNQNVCDIIDKMDEKWKEAFVNIKLSPAIDPKGDIDRWIKAWEICNEEIPKLRYELEKEFRKLLKVK